MATPITLISFGYVHSAPPQAHRVVDVRDRLRDLAAAQDVLDLDGRDELVQRAVLSTPGVPDVLSQLLDDAERLPADKPRRVAIGCASGCHHSVALIELLATCLAVRDHDVRVEHQHADLPRVIREGEGRGRGE